MRRSAFNRPGTHYNPDLNLRSPGSLHLRNLDFVCECGQGRFITGTDNRSYLARCIPDQDYDAFSEVIDDAIEGSGPTAADKDAACVVWRAFPMLHVWQCYACGCVYIEGPNGEHHRFLPASADVPRHLFQRP